MADMSLSDRYDYLKAAKASIYNNVKERGVEGDGAGLKIKGASGKGKRTASALAAGVKGRWLQLGKGWWGRARGAVPHGRGAVLCHGSAVLGP